MYEFLALGYAAGVHAGPDAPVDVDACLVSDGGESCGWGDVAGGVEAQAGELLDEGGAPVR